MSLADLSIKRPSFITSIVILMLAVGYLSLKRLGVDLFPNVTFPIVVVQTVYPGAGPAEIETLVSKPLEDEISTISGLKRLSSQNQEGVSIVIAEFSLETDVKYAEQQIRDRVSAAKSKLPTEVKDSVIRRVDPADQPIYVLSVTADLPPADLYDLAHERIKPRLEQIPSVGLVEIVGGRKREVHIELDRDRLKAREISVSGLAMRLSAAGENVPVGKIDQGAKELVFRSLGQFSSLEDIRQTVVNFFGSEVPVKISDLGTVSDKLEDEKNRVYVNGQKSLFIPIYRQSGSNTIAVVDAVKQTVEKLNTELALQPGKPKLAMVRDASVWIRANVTDVKESIFIGIALTIIVVFFFLGSGRSTIITGLALPNSLLGAFILMSMAGFSVNIMTLLALSLAVGLLVDDAIVVRENIFRHIEMGKSPIRASKEGTKEVTLAVLATTLAVLAVFGPVGFLKGVVGQFFKEFGLTICFAMAISLFDALTIAPMLSAYFAGKPEHEKKRGGIYQATVGRMLGGFNNFQTWLEGKYEKILKFTLRRPLLVLFASFGIFVVSIASVKFVPKTFLPPQDAGEFAISLDLPPGTSLDEMNRVAAQVDQILRAHPEVQVSALTVGGTQGESNTAEFYVLMVPAKQRKINTIVFKQQLRDELKSLAAANPKVKDYDAVGGGQRPFNLNIVSDDQKLLEASSQKVLKYMQSLPGLLDVDSNFRPGKPEFQVALDNRRADALGVSSVTVGRELRAQMEGITAGKYREKGLEYDIRVRLKPEQRNLAEGYERTFVPNMNNQLVRLADVSHRTETEGPAKIWRQDRGRYVQISADIAPGAGMGDIMADLNARLTTGDLKLPEGVRYAFVGQAENFQELASNMAVAMGLGILFIYLVLASLYESFVTPFTIMLALPLAMCGSFLALLITQESLNIFSMIGVIMLLGVASKNSILLVDYANQRIAEGKTRAEAMIEAGRTRLRPILMTTMALIAGTIPIAIGLNEASKQRTSMGIAIVGGLISSTLLTLIVIPAAFSYIDRFRVWSNRFAKRAVGSIDPHAEGQATHQPKV